MDAPNLTFSELEDLAANRKRWKEHVISKFGKITRKKTIANRAPKPATNTLTSLPTAVTSITRTTNRTSSNKPATNTANTYRQRDAKAILLYPALYSKHKPKPKPKPKQKQTKPLTNKQRHQFARAHYQLHHGTQTDNQTVSNTIQSPKTDKWTEAAYIPSDLSTKRLKVFNVPFS